MDSNGSAPLSPASTGEPTHLRDYWNVVVRRFWLVLVVFAVTTASAMWAVAQQETFYEAHLTLQVNDPIQPARGLVGNRAVSGMDIFVDPMQSEIQVLLSSQVALAVIESLGLRLVPDEADLPRSALFRQVSVDPELPPGAYTLAYDADGTTAVLSDASGIEVGRAAAGELLQGPGLAFVPAPAPRESRSYPLRVVPARSIIPEISANLRAAPTESTNIIEARLLSSDPELVDDMLNAAAQELRAIGARRVASQASRDIQFIEAQLDTARQNRSEAAGSIQTFKESQEFTTLSAREQALVERLQTVQRDIESVDREQDALADIARRIADVGPREIDFAAVQASLPEGTNRQIRDLIEEIRAASSANRLLRVEERLAPGHPRVEASEAQIDRLAEEIVQAVGARLGVIQDELEILLAREGEIRDQQQLFPNLENQLAELEQQKAFDDDAYQFLVSQLYQARIRQSAASPYVEVIDPAVGALATQPGGTQNILLGGLLGLVLGIGAAFFVEYLDRTVRTASDVEGLLGLPVLGVIPRLRRTLDEEPNAQGRRTPLVVAMDPSDPAAESYRTLRVNLLYMNTEERPLRTLLVSSPGPDEGKSTTAVNTAIMLAQQGQPVLLVDADLRRPSLHRALDVLREPGLTNLLVGDADARACIRPGILPNLDLLPSGPFPPNPSELLNSRTMTRLLEDFQTRYSYVVVDAPPVLAVTDAAVLASHVDGIVVVLRSGSTEQRAAEKAVERLRRLNARLVGAVLNEVRFTGGEEDYYLQYYYEYQRREKRPANRLRASLSKVRFW